MALSSSAPQGPCKTRKKLSKTFTGRLRPGDPPTVANANALIKRLFFDARGMTSVAWPVQINQKLNRNADLENRILEKEDLIEAIKYVVSLRKRRGSVTTSTISQRRLRTVGETAGQPMPDRISPARSACQGAHDALRRHDNTMTPQALVNPKALSAVHSRLFRRSQLASLWIRRIH